MAKRYVSVYDLPRNDIAACRAFWASREISAEDWRIMLKLQDDPAELETASKRWRRPGPRR